MRFSDRLIKTSRLKERIQETLPYLALALLMGVVYALSFFNYLLFHAVVEMISIAVGWSIFLLMVNTRRHLQNNYLIMIAVMLFFIGIVDLIHTLAYKGMGVFPADANLPTQLWIGARYLQSLTMLGAALLPVDDNQLNRNRFFWSVNLAYALLTAALFYAVFGGYFPACYVEGQGLTPFKIYSEYIISAIFMMGLILLLERPQKLPTGVIRELSIAIGFMILAELAFTQYVSVYGPANALGHIARIGMIYMLYRAILQTALTRPYEMLYRDLSESENRLRNMVKHTQAGYFFLDLDGRFSAVNPAWLQMHGYPSAKEVIGQSFEMAMSPEDAAQIADFYRELKETGSLVTEMTRRNANGSLGYQAISAHTVHHDNQPVGIEGFIIDITKRKKAEKALAESEARLHQAQSLANLGAFRLSLPDETLWCSKQLSKIFEFAPDETPSPIKMARAFHPADRQAWLDMIMPPTNDTVPDTGDQSGLRREQELRLLAKDQRTRYLHIVCEYEALDDSAGWVVNGSVQNISERKRLQSEIVESQKMAALGTLTSGLAHEMNSPLQAIISGLEGLMRRARKDPNFDAGSIEKMEKVYTNVWRVANVVKALTTYIQMVPIPFITCDLNKIISAALQQMEATSIPGERIEVHTQLDKNLPQFYCQEAQIQKALFNLVKNAYDAMPDGGTLTLSSAYEREKRQLVVRVEDSGPGIAAEAHQRIFDPFFTTKAIGKGMGLGLATAMGIVKAHGGDMIVSDAQPHGALFTLTFPDQDTLAQDEPPSSVEFKPTGRYDEPSSSY